MPYLVYFQISVKDPLKCFLNATSYFTFHLAFSDLLNSLIFMEESLLWLTKFGGINGLPRAFRILNNLVFQVVFIVNPPSIFSLVLECCLSIVSPCPPKFFERIKSAALFVMKSALFVQTNVAVNTNLTSKVPFVFSKHIYSYVVNSILTPKTPLLCPKHIAICPTTGCIVVSSYALDVPKLSLSYDHKQIGSTVLDVLESRSSKFQNFRT